MCFFASLWMAMQWIRSSVHRRASLELWVRQLTAESMSFWNSALAMYNVQKNTLHFFTLSSSVEENSRKAWAEKCVDEGKDVREELWVEGERRMLVLSCLQSPSHLHPNLSPLNPHPSRHPQPFYFKTCLLFFLVLLKVVRNVKYFFTSDRASALL